MNCGKNKNFNFFIMFPPSFQLLISEYQALDTPRERFQFLLELSESLPPVLPEQKIEKNTIKGCASKAWVFVQKDSHGKIQIFGDAEAQISKGMLAFFALGLSGCFPEEILKITDTELEKSGVFTSLSPSRSNGALSTWRMIFHAVQ